jgi:ribosome-binding ATPase YchF (GTP1/OBG family)
MGPRDGKFACNEKAVLTYTHRIYNWKESETKSDAYFFLQSIFKLSCFFLICPEVWTSQKGPIFCQAAGKVHTDLDVVCQLSQAVSMSP